MSFARIVTFILRWNIIDALVIQVTLALHNIALRTFAGANFHGAYAIMFSLIYFIQSITNAGFESTLGFYWRSAMSIRGAFFITRELLLQQLVCWLGIACFMLWNPSYFTTLFELVSWPLIIAAICIESIKRHFRAYLFFSLQNQPAFWIEFAGLCLYLLGNWFYYGMYEFSLSFAVISLMIISLLQSLCSAVIFLSWLFSLSPSGELALPTRAALWKTRFFTFTNQSIAQLFTSNFIIPYFALFCSLASVSTVTILINFFTICYKFIQRTVSMTLLSGYVQLQTRANQLLHKNMLIRKLMYFLMVAGVSIITLVPLLTHSYCNAEWQHLSAIVFIFALLTITEGIFALYDKLFIMEGSAFILTAINAFFVGTFSVSVPFLYLTDMQFIMLVLILRLITLGLVIVYYYKRAKKGS